MAAMVGERRGVIAAINVTPMADVMIVLLIIFLVVTPLIVEDERLQVPSARHGLAEEPRPSLVVALRRDRSLALGDEPLPSAEDLEVRLQAALAAEPNGRRTVWLRADRQLTYADVGPVIERCRAAGAEEVALAVALDGSGS